MRELLLLNFIIPLVMLLVSIFLKRGSHPYPGPARYQTKWKVDFSGYNTPSSRKSQERWEYAQQLAPVAFFRNAIPALAVAVVCSVIGLFWQSAEKLPLWCLGFVFVVRAFRQVERALKQTFGA